LLPEENTGLQKIRRARVGFQFLLFGYLPLVLLAARIPRPALAIPAMTVVWVIAFVRSATRVAFNHCPRCGKYFHAAGDAPSFRNLLARSCMHCGIPLNTSRVIYPSME
jgi:hypothetical protein